VDNNTPVCRSSPLCNVTLLNLYSCGVLLTDSGFSGEIRRDKVGREEAFAAPRHTLPPVHITGSNKHTDTPLKAILAMASHYTHTCARMHTHTHTPSHPHTHERAHTRAHAHTHTRLTALFPGLPRWAGTRKAKPNWILLKQETVSGNGISWAI